MRILVVEDEARIGKLLKKGLEAEGYAVDLAVDGAEGLRQGAKKVYDLILLDLMLPKVDGLDVCKQLRRQKITTPILMLTARDTTQNKIDGLDVGADDYVTKPFEFDELLARVRALLRRPADQVKSSLLRVGDIKINLKSREVHRGQKKIDLTSKEFSLLEYLARHPGEVITRTKISEHVWDQNYDPFSNIVDVYIRYLRRKLGQKSTRGIIETVRGAGYRLRNDYGQKG